ncbi:MAG TPA: shufflon system plasmid conjugative transfer pilus tip adhesin PilV [Burkholderiaceae bacterium]|nr:shufflon system plasmid conjugative transfer pilus tip adhesin PilV [Burkholderiaceae bacterium]
MTRQRGFALLELVVAALITTLLAVWGANAWVHRLDEANAHAMAAWMLAAREGVQAYIHRHGISMAQMDAGGTESVPGFQDWRTPTVPELKGAGLLADGFPEAGPGGLRVAVRILSGKNCPGSDCSLEALILGSPPLLDKRSGEVDEQKVALWLLASRGLGGVVNPRDPASVRGAAFGFANPPAAGMSMLPVGTPAMAITTAGSSDGAQFLRVRDDRDPDFQGTASVRGGIRSDGSVTAGEYVIVGARHTVRSSCGQEGAVARDAYRGLLICQSGLWRSAGGSGGGGFSTNTVYGCFTSSGLSTANPVTGSCNCPLGHAMVAISDSGSAASPDGRTRGYLCVE